MSKTINGTGLKHLAELTQVCFDIYRTQDLVATIQERIEVAKKLAAETECLNWINLIDITSSVLAFSGEDDVWEPLCKVLEVLGWQVVEDEQGDG